MAFIFSVCSVPCPGQSPAPGEGVTQVAPLQQIILENRASLLLNLSCRATHFKYNDITCRFLVDPFLQLIYTLVRSLQLWSLTASSEVKLQDAGDQRIEKFVWLDLHGVKFAQISFSGIFSNQFYVFSQNQGAGGKFKVLTLCRVNGWSLVETKSSLTPKVLSENLWQLGPTLICS